MNIVINYLQNFQLFIRYLINLYLFDWLMLFKQNINKVLFKLINKLVCNGKWKKLCTLVWYLNCILIKIYLFRSKKKKKVKYEGRKKRQKICIEGGH